MSDPPDGASPWNKYEADRLRLYVDEVATAVSSVGFTLAANDGLSSSAMIRGFQTGFESFAFASFHITGDTGPLAHRLRSFGDRVPRVGDPYAESLLSSDAVRRELPELAIDPALALSSRSGSFEFVDPLLLEGSLAMALRDGGPYSGMSASGAQTVARDFCNLLIGDRLDEFAVLSGEGWTDWFHEMGWDHNWIITDLGKQQVHLLCCSGSD